ncbi:transketolase [Clostridium sp. MD294]|uniref:transketolase n=1 Tax=Clostridium sp. MD294 TaxID=97138 RepID=UPI0002CC0DDF|nr:transketolase [Clostridium sp. MD294]NDO46097.1 transketolase [Clostridium sp. MD294]USF30237.1 Transketolase [Clostridium sp. MD294]
MEQIEQLSINTIRFLSADAIQKANSGHPGLPLGAAPAAYALWAKEMKHNPANPDWADRDRFVLSAGHGSAMLYSLLHLFGYGLTIEDLKQFRQKGSFTPGHPEYKWTKGVEITTGPLGQGIANAVGFALAEKHLAAKFNTEEHKIVDHYTFVMCGDGCLMEGVSAEAASLAATMGLGKLILLYDSNNITIEGSTDIAFTEDVLKRFEAYGWHTQEVCDGTDIDTIAKAIEFAKREKSKPSIIKIDTIIGYGAPNKQGKASAHGEPLGEEEIKAAKQNADWTETENFAVPQQVVEHMKALQLEGAKKEQQWNTLFEQYKKVNPELAKEWEIWHSNKLPVDLLNDDDYWTYEGDIATRASSEKVLQKLSKVIPNLIGGSADLAPSNKSVMKDRQYYSAQTPEGSNIHFGIREFAMTAMANGMAAHGGLRPYIAGFFVFSDYMKSGLRMSSLMELPVISIMTHDSIGVGEDGPTHQPVEHLAALRSMPNHIVFRPCDTRETAAGWLAALMTETTPTALVLTRQNLPLLEGTGKEALKGAYVLRDCQGTPDVLLMASGSEVELIYKAYDVLAEKGIKARVISMPSFELFEKQSQEYKESVLPNAVRNRVAVEAASSFGWHKYVGLDGATVTIDTFGASAPAGTLFKEFGFTVENVVETALKVVAK